MDGVLHNQDKVHMIHTIDDRLKSGEPIEFAGKKYSLSELNQLLPLSEDRVSFVIEWDNMCQYMAVGLVSVINDLLHQDRILHLEDFFNRDDSYPCGIDYIKYEFYKDILKPEVVDKVYASYYTQIMERSPITLFFDRLNLLKPMVKQISFVFKNNFPSLSTLIETINHTYFNDELECSFYIAHNENDHKAIIKISNADVFVVPDMGLYYETLLNLKKKDKTILSYTEHNGVNKYILAMYVNVFMTPNAKPINNISLDFIDELKKDYTSKEEEPKEDTNEN